MDGLNFLEMLWIGPAEVWVLFKNGLLFAVILSFLLPFVWGQTLLTGWMQKLA